MRRLLPYLSILCSIVAAMGQPPAAPPESVRLEYPNAQIDVILRVYEELTGKQVIADNSVYQGGTVNIVVSGKDVPRDEAIHIIEINLLLNGYSIVPDGDKIVKVLGAAKSPTSAGIPFYTSPLGLPDRELVVSYLFKLQYANPADLSAIISSYISPQNWTRIVPVPNAQALLITESTSVIRNLIEIVSQIDTPPAEVVSEFITLQRADAEDVIEKLQAIFETDPNVTANRTIQRQAAANIPPAPPGGPAAPNVPTPGQNTVEISAGLSEDSIIVGKIRLTADVRTNRLHVVTRPINLPFLRELIAEFDSDVKFGDPTTRSLRFVSAGEILPVIVQAISDPGSEDAAAQSQQLGSTSNAPRAQPVGAGGGGFGGGSNSGGGTFTVSEGLSTEPADTTPEAVTVGNTKIIADKRANSIIVLGNEEVKQKVFRVIDEIDVRAPQVLLNTVIGEMSLNDNEEFGVDYLYRSISDANPAAPDANGNIGASPEATGAAILSRTTAGPLIDIGNVTGIASLAGTGSALTALVAPTNSLQILVTALESTSRFRVTSRPMVFTSNNKKAIIASGQEIAVPVSSLTSLTGGNNVPSVQSSIQYKTIALQLEVVPLINSDREVSLDILQKVDNISGSSIIDGNAIPTIATRYIKTSVSVPNRGTVVLGGLITTTKDKGYSGLPLLSRIPLIGPLFRTTRDNEQRTELIILMRPVVTWDPSENIHVREQEEQRLVIPPDLDSTLTPPGERRVLRATPPKLKTP